MIIIVFLKNPQLCVYQHCSETFRNSCLRPGPAACSLLLWAQEMSHGLELARWLTNAVVNKIPRNLRKHVQLHRDFSCRTNKKGGMSSRLTSDVEEGEGNLLSAEAFQQEDGGTQALHVCGEAVASIARSVRFCPFLLWPFHVLNKFSFDITPAVTQQHVLQPWRLVESGWACGCFSNIPGLWRENVKSSPPAAVQKKAALCTEYPNHQVGGLIKEDSAWCYISAPSGSRHRYNRDFDRCCLRKGQSITVDSI